MIERGVDKEAINWKVLYKLGENWRNGARFPCFFARSNTDQPCQVDAPFKPSSPTPERAQLPKIGILPILKVGHRGLYVSIAAERNSRCYRRQRTRSHPHG